jgi:hypothetical protein
MQEILLVPFALIRRALLISITMGIGRLLDKGESRARGKMRTNLSFARLLKIIEPYAPDGLKSKLSLMLTELETLCKPIDLWRDTRFGHADKEMVLGTGDQGLNDVERETFEKALGSMFELLKVIHVHFNGFEAELLFPVPVGYANILIGFIQDGANARRAEIAKMFP